MGGSEIYKIHCVWSIFILMLNSAMLEGISLANRTSCLNCPDVESPDKCHLTTLCDVNEVCYAEVIRLNGKDRFRLGCVQPTACDFSQAVATQTASIIGRKRFLDQPRPFSSFCGMCCKDSIANCNRDLCRSGTTIPPRTGETLPKTDCFYESTRYAGTYRHTISGHPCISWELANQQASISGPWFPERNIKDVENKCRDPTDKGHPWCFTNVLLEWNYCPVPYCAECFYKGNSAQYNGYVSKDQDNNTCLPWTSFNNTMITDSMFPDRSIVNASNHCRDVFGIGPYCYTATGNRKCNVPECPGTCEDDPNTNCTLIKSFVCAKEFTRKTLCPKTCGNCGFGLMPPRPVPPPQECKDQIIACQSLKDTICKNLTAAREDCPRTCNVGCATRTHAWKTQQVIVDKNSTVSMTTPTTATAGPYSCSSWGVWKCETNSAGRCLMGRHRNCSTGINTDCSGKQIDVRLCNMTLCAGRVD